VRQPFLRLLHKKGRAIERPLRIRDMHKVSIWDVYKDTS